MRGYNHVGGALACLAQMIKKKKFQLKENKLSVAILTAARAPRSFLLIKITQRAQVSAFGSSFRLKIHRFYIAEYHLDILWPVWKKKKNSAQMKPLTCSAGDGWRCEERQRCCYISLSHACTHCAVLRWLPRFVYFTSGNYNASCQSYPQCGKCWQAHLGSDFCFMSSYAWIPGCHKKNQKKTTQTHSMPQPPSSFFYSSIGKQNTHTTSTHTHTHTRRTYVFLFLSLAGAHGRTK